MNKSDHCHYDILPSTQILNALNEFGFDAEFETGEDGDTTSLMRLVGQKVGGRGLWVGWGGLLVGWV